MVFGWVKSQRLNCGRLPKQTTESDRVVLSSEPSLCLPNDRHNYISTRRYNWFTFLPLSLLFQFRKLSNCYFLFIAILVQIPGLTPVNRYSTVVPLIFVLVVSELREFLEEWNASQRDKETNETQVPLLVGATKSSNIRPGDVIKVHRDKFVPCDILILQTSNSDGSCFVETSSLDGETNLRLKRAPACTNSLPPSNLLEKCAIKVVCDAPNADMHSFGGRVELDKASEDVSLINIVWRGSTVRNTDWVIGLVIFSGDDTTILLNLKAVGLIPSKTTQMENQMNRNVLFIFLLQIILCAIAASIGSPVNQPWYLDSARRAGWQSLFFGYFILLASLIPVSLWVSVEILKLFQSWLIEATERTRKLGGGVNCNAKNLHEELGQITHVFTDKTGTLTSNCMRFVGCCVGDKMYLETADAAPINLKIDFQGIVAPSRELIDQVSTRKNFLLFKCLSLCHTCERITEPLTGQVTNQSLSPDEAALVSMAAECGVIFQGRPAADKISIAHDFDEQLRVLYELPFTSERKMMSVVVQDREDKIFIFSKGADSVIIPKCVNETSIVVNAVDEFSRFGYRTLCCAYREIPKTEWDGIANTIARSGHVRNRIVADDSDTDGAVSPISPYSSLESNLILIGCTAVEDKLQDGVPETLRAMKAAGIKVCMITGDKRETAINIATSCGLIGSKKNVHVMLNGKKKIV
jgi:phospholipid-transporting ATPase